MDKLLADVSISTQIWKNECQFYKDARKVAGWLHTYFENSLSIPEDTQLLNYLQFSLLPRRMHLSSIVKNITKAKKNNNNRLTPDLIKTHMPVDLLAEIESAHRKIISDNVVVPAPEKTVTTVQFKAQNGHNEDNLLLGLITVRNMDMLDDELPKFSAMNVWIDLPYGVLDYDVAGFKDKVLPLTSLQNLVDNIKSKNEVKNFTIIWFVVDNQVEPLVALLGEKVCF
jgi:hypothetical protein